MFSRLVTCLCAAALASACVTADDATDLTQARSDSTAGPPRPPAEAIAACADATAGAACAFDLDDHHVTGTCRGAPDGDGPLACAPPHPPLPPEAIAACAGATAGDSCAFDHDGHTIDGTCRAAPDGEGPLGCAPDNPPPPPPH